MLLLLLLACGIGHCDAAWVHACVMPDDAGALHVVIEQDGRREELDPDAAGCVEAEVSPNRGLLLWADAGEGCVSEAQDVYAPECETVEVTIELDGC